MKFRLILEFQFFLTCFAMSQEKFTVDEVEKKFIHHFFLAEKHKVLEEYDKAMLEYENCLNLRPKESSVFFEMPITWQLPAIIILTLMFGRKVVYKAFTIYIFIILFV